MTKKYKALLTDFDNTLVGADYTVNNEIQKKIRQLKDNSIVFSIATGRAYPGIIKQTCKQMNLTSPQITWGGAYIIDPVTDTPLWKETMLDSDATEILGMLKKMNLYTIVDQPEACYTSDGQPLHTLSIGLKMKRLDELPIHDIAKIVISAQKNNISESQTDELVKKISHHFPTISVIKYKNPYGRWGFDITSEKATKHTAVLEYLKIMNLKPEEVVGIGDGYNDYPLLTACGLKIAMGDAPDEVKEIAHFIAPTQKENGLLIALNKYFP